MQIKFLVAAILVGLSATVLMAHAATANAYAAVATGSCSTTCTIAVDFDNFAKAIACATGVGCISTNYINHLLFFKRL